VSFQRSLVSQTSLIIAQYESGNRSHCSYDEHMQLIDAIEARDAQQAVSLMMHHMDHIDSKLNLDEERVGRFACGVLAFAEKAQGHRQGLIVCCLNGGCFRRQAGPTLTAPFSDLRCTSGSRLAGSAGYWPLAKALLDFKPANLHQAVGLAQSLRPNYLRKGP
jgi:hypothetical protein